MLDNCHFTKTNLFKLQPILGNSLIKIDGKSLNSSILNNRKDITIADFFIPETDLLLNFNEFCHKHNLSLNFLTHLSIKKAIIKAAKDHCINLSSCIEHPHPRPPLLYSILTSNNKGCRKFYKILMSKIFLRNNTSNIEMRWHKELGKIYNLKTWDDFKTLNAQIKHHNSLKWLQYRVLRKCLHTNKILEKYVPNKSNLCDFCSSEIETISHLFYECLHTKKMFHEIKEFYKSVGINIAFNLKNVLFGEPAESFDSILNMTILYFKGYVWQCKYKKNIPNLLNFKAYLKNHLVIFV